MKPLLPVPCVTLELEEERLCVEDLFAKETVVLRKAGVGQKERKGDAVERQVGWSRHSVLR